MSSIDDLEQRLAAVEAALASELHYGEHKSDTAEIKAGLAQIVQLLEGLNGPSAPS